MTHLPDAAADLQLAIDAVRAAGDEVRARFGGGSEVRFKSPHQPVTEADLVADDLLRSRLLGARPHYGWLSEETADSTERLTRRRVWVVDPIDGTNSFIAGIPEFVISVGLVEDGITAVAAVYNPITDELYHAVRGGGAYRSGQLICVAGEVPAGEEPVMVASRWEIERGVHAAFAVHWRLNPLGSTAYRMLKVADGSAHAFTSPSWKHEWDVCGATLIVEEAGGRVSSGDGNALRFNRPLPRFEGIRAWTPAVRLEPAAG